ncbi:MAG TPA: MBL fold metallo-hydrolase, partial [Thermodesulfobacteriota bacterium]|nr:MBL fold metallo-hydrolase [Thermodesulfobacteriota bacterium]
LSLVILTHCHIDHVGGAPYFRRHYGCRLAAHELDAPAIESGDPVRTAASFYGCYFPPTPIDVFLCGSEMTISCGEQEIHCLHTPGHTPGSLSPYFDRGSRRILIGQDVHGPFLPGFGSDKNLWKASMNKLLHLKADVLCEGHFGVFQPAQEVEAYIRRQVEKNS